MEMRFANVLGRRMAFMLRQAKQCDVNLTRLDVDWLSYFSYGLLMHETKLFELRAYIFLRIITVLLVATADTCIE
jgi:hypothetical protein